MAQVRNDGRTRVLDVPLKPGISYSYSSIEHPTIVEERSVALLEPMRGMLSAHPDTPRFPNALLVIFSQTKGDNTDCVYREVYFSLPGPIVTGPIYFDNDRGPVRTYHQDIASVLEVYDATITTGGTGGTNGVSRTVTGTTGTGTKFQASVVISGGAITVVNSITVAGIYTKPPTDESAEPVTDAALTGATLNVKLRISSTIKGTQTLTGTPSDLVTETRYETYPETIYVLRKVIETWTLTGAAVVSNISGHPDPESAGVISTDIRVQPESTANAGFELDGGDLIDHSYETFLPGIAVKQIDRRYAPTPYADFASALKEYRLDPYQFPGRLDTSPFGMGGAGFVYAWSPPASRSVLHTDHTYWVISTITPVLAYDEMIPDSLFIQGKWYISILHDAVTIDYGDGIIIDFPATTPDYTTFIGTWVGTERIIDGFVKKLIGGPDGALWIVKAIGVIMY